MQLHYLKEIAEKIKNHYAEEFDVVIQQGEFKIGTISEDDNFAHFISINVSDYTTDGLDDFALSTFIATFTPKQVCELINEIESLQKRVKELEKTQSI